MKCLRFVVAFAGLVPSLVYAQNQQFSDCHTLEVAGNFLESDEALVNGLVCKVRNPKTNSAASMQVAGKAADRSPALLGIIEPEILRSKDNAGASPVGTALTPGAAPGWAASDSRADSLPQASPTGEVPGKSLGEIARAYRKVKTRTTTQLEEGNFERKKPMGGVEDVATLSDKTTKPATAAQLEPARSMQVPPAAESPTPTRKAEIIAAPPATVLSTPTEPPQAAKNEVMTVPQTQPNTVKQAANPATAEPLHEPTAKLGTNLPAMAAPASGPEVRAPARTEIVASVQRTPKEQVTASPLPSAREEAPEIEPERSLRAGEFSQPPAAGALAQPRENNTADDGPFKEGQASTCIKNVSLGSMDKDKLFLAIPDWALKWYEKNQKRFPGICFSDSLMPNAHNYLVVFYTAAPHVAGTSLTNISAPGDVTPASGKGGFTTGYGSTWHYTYERTVTTTITSVSAEKAPHNEPSILLYATAYSEQGIPVSHRYPTSVTKPDKKTSTKPGKGHDVTLLEFRAMAELLNQVLEDIAKL